LSKALISDISKILLRPEEWYKTAGIETVLDEVTSIDFKEKKARTKSGKSYSYTKLILATGGTPKMLPLPGFKDLNNVFLLRTVEDVRGITSAVGESKSKKIVIIGSSFIGMEVGNALSKDNAVTIVGMEKQPMERVMGEEVGKIFRKQLEKNGVKFQMEAGVEKATPKSLNSKDVGAVHLKDGNVLEADIVVLGVGVAPATEFLKDSAEVKLEKDGSLKCNELFEVEGLEDVYAIGDIATYPYHGPGGEGHPTRIEHWNVAQNSGRSVGARIAAPGKKPKAFIPVFWSALGSQLRYCGNTMNGWDDLVLKGQPEESKFAAYYAKGETVVAVASMQMDPIMTKCAELMRRGKMPSKSELQSGVDPLTLQLPAEVKI
jgi:NADPH-dependent 2,4-dienoyl-CoA reductase/sulfur reductase-like enzyme